MKKRDKQWHERRLERLLKGVSKFDQPRLLVCDPTPFKEFVGYLASLYRVSDIQGRERLMTEDAGKAQAYLCAMQALNGKQLGIKLHKKTETGEKQALSLPELLKSIEPHLTKLADLPQPDYVQHWLGDEIAGVGKLVETTTKTYSAEEQALLDSRSLEIVFDQGPLKLWKINDHAGAIFAGRGTKWCTTEADGKNFNYYHEQASLFALAIRGTADKYQFHFRDFQVNDARDEPVELANIMQSLPVGATLRADFKTTLAQATVDDFRQRQWLPVAPIGNDFFNTRQIDQLMDIAEQMADDDDAMQHVKAAAGVTNVTLAGTAGQRHRGMVLAAHLVCNKGSEFSGLVCDTVANNWLDRMAEFEPDECFAALMAVKDLHEDEAAGSVFAGIFVKRLEDFSATERTESLPLVAAMAVSNDTFVRRQVVSLLPQSLYLLPEDEQAQVIDIIRPMARDCDILVCKNIARQLPSQLEILPPRLQDEALQIVATLANDWNYGVRSLVAHHTPEAFKERLAAAKEISPYRPTAKQWMQADYLRNWDRN